MKDWVATTGCAARDASNGLKWALAPHSKGDIATYLYPSIESLRNCDLEVSTRAFQVIVQHHSFQKVVHEYCELEKWWIMLGMEPKWLEEFRLLDPHW